MFGLVMLWSAQGDLALRRFQFHAAAAAIDGAAAQLDRFTDRAKALADLVASADDGCAILMRDAAEPFGFEAGRLIARNGTGCSTGRNPMAGAIDDIRSALAGGDGPAYGNDGSPEGRLAIGLRLGNDPANLLILYGSPTETGLILDPQKTPFITGLALFSAGHPIAERHSAELPSVWWPDGPAIDTDGSRRGLVALNRQDGGTATYFVTPIDPAGRFVLVGQQMSPFLGGEQWRLWTSLAQLAAILVATIGGALWAIDRSVLRWIDYLRRITVAHSRGHHSVRAKRLASAPRELADLGESLNLMANDAGRRVALLRESAADKSALLLELHHRVKNNFQVITSLLSLLRQDMPLSRRDEIRFVEDFVRAMAVVYRVAYDSGDVTGVVLQDLLRNVIEALRDLAGAAPDQIVIETMAEPLRIDLDKAISLGLYLAVTLPPYLDAAASNMAIRTTISASRDREFLRIAIAGTEPFRPGHPPLRRRLRFAYQRQLKASPDPGGGAHETAIRMPLGEDRRKHPLAAMSTAAPPSPRVSVEPPISLPDAVGIAAAGAGIMLSGQDTELRYQWVCGAQLFDRPIDAIPSGTDRELLAPAAADAFIRAKRQVLADGVPSGLVLHIPEPAPERWIAAQIQPIQDDASRTTGIVTACSEVTVFKATEKRMTLLMREMAHRSKNILAVTEAIARQSIAHATSLDDFGDRFSARLHSLAGSHDLLTRRDWEGARLHDLVRSQLGHYLLSEPPQIAIDGPDVFLTSTAVPYLGLALHELSTNAAKYGALSVAAGQVAISWGLGHDPDGQELLWLTWIEIGGPAVVAPTRRGFGTDVTKRIVSRALRGEVTLDFAPGGLSWRLDVPTASLMGQA